MVHVRFALLAVLSVGLKVGLLAQTFNSPPLLPTAFDPSGLAAGDFNGDGNPDLVYVDGASQTPTLHVLLGRGDGTFSHGQDVALPSGICVFHCTINVADVSGDGILDLIMGGGNQFTGAIAVLLGKGDGTFQAPIVSTTPPNTALFVSLDGTMAVGDFNGDGAPDLAVGDQNFGIHILLGDKSGSFTQSTALPDDTLSRDIRTADLNHDGHLDLVALGNPSSGGFNVFLGNGDGTFQFPVLYSPGASGFFADFDGDGQPDILTSFNSTGTLNQIILIKGNPDGTFASPVVVGQLPNNLFLVNIGDFNGDGILDLQVTNQTGVGILLGQPGLSFGSMITSLSGASPLSFPPGPTLADFNKDGHLDLAVPSDGGITLLLGKGDGSFSNGGAQVYDLGTPVTTLAVADFNGDRIPDIAVAINAAIPRLLLGQPGGTFVLAPDPNTTHGFGPETIAVGDFNGDGHADLSLGPIGSAAPTVLFGNGQGGFAAPLTVTTGAPDIGDFNRDRRSDMIGVDLAQAACFPDCPLTVSLGQSNDTFVIENTVLLGGGGALTAIGDLNGDGIPDVVLTNGGLQVWLGKGDGTFSQGISLDISSFTGGLAIASSGAAIADLDGDGKNDLVLTTQVVLGNPFIVTPKALMVLYGKGDGTFESPVLIPLSHFYKHLTIADVNQDHRPDLILDDGTGIAVILNLGNRAFEDESHYVAGTAIAGLTAVDVNGDGFPDLVVANPGATTVVVLLNNPTGSPPGGLHPLVGLSIAPEPSGSGTAFTATASVAAPNATSPAPTGSVDFFLDGILTGTVSLASGTASFTITGTLTPGLHQMVAAYSGDQVFGMASANQEHTVTPPVFPTQTVLTATPATVLTSQTVHLVATLSATGGTPCPPIPSNICSWGTVTFFDGTQTLSAQPADQNGIAVFDTALLAAGTHSLSATYHGFSNSNEIFPPSSSAPVTVTANSTATATTATASAGSVTAGSVVTLGASVTSGTGIPFGGVTFFDGNVPLGAMSLQSNGAASFSTASLSVGTHSISATFNANATFAGSTSSPVTLVVEPAPATSIATFAALSATLHPESGNVAFQATVVAERGSPQSTVIFLDGGVILGKAMTDPAGLAVLTLPIPDRGLHGFRASFSGNPEFAPSASPELQEFWPDSGPAFSLLVNPAIVRFDSGGGETQITIATPTALQGPVQLACASGLPVGYSCTFEPQSLSQAGTSRLSVHSSVARKREHLFNASTAAFALMALFVFGSLVFPRRRACLLLIVLCCAGFYALLGCGAALQERQHISVVTIQAISGTGPSHVLHSNQIVFMVPNHH